MLTTSLIIVANEFRAWLLHYSIPVLRGILPSVYLNHHCLLAWAIFTLLGDEISIEDVNKSHNDMSHAFLRKANWADKQIVKNPTIFDLENLKQMLGRKTKRKDEESSRKDRPLGTQEERTISIIKEKQTNKQWK